MPGVPQLYCSKMCSCAQRRSRSLISRTSPAQYCEPVSFGLLGRDLRPQVASYWLLSLGAQALAKRTHAQSSPCLKKPGAAILSATHICCVCQPLLRDYVAFWSHCLARHSDPRPLRHLGSAGEQTHSRAGQRMVTELVELSSAAG